MDANQVQLKNINRRTVLNYIRRHSFATKAELAASTGFTFAAVKKILDELENQRLVRFAHIEKKAVGRNSAVYEINPDYGYMVSIYMNRKKIYVAVVNLGRQIISRQEIPMEKRRLTQKELIEILLQTVNAVLDACGIPRERFLGVGIGVPGPIDPAQGLILTPPNMPVLHYLPLKAILESRLGMPVHMHKDTNVVAMGEYWAEHGRCDENLVYLDIDMGIGSGMIINGQINAGVDGKAGEFGHTTIEVNGPRCNCGNHGCLEAVASGLAMLRDYGAELQQYPEHPLYAARESLKIDDLIRAYNNKDMVAIAIVNKAAFYVGIGVANVINFLDPEKIVLGGLFLREFSGAYDIITNVAAQRIMKNGGTGNIVKSSLGSDAGIIGCADVVTDDFFREAVNSIWAKN